MDDAPRNLPLFQRAVEKWSVDYLSEHMGNQLYLDEDGHTASIFLVF